MSNWRDHGPVTDEDLVAYLDGMLDDESAEYVEREANKDRALDVRLELLRRGERPFAEAFDALLREAPDRRLTDILKEAKEPPPPPVEEPVPEPETGPVPTPGPVGSETGRPAVRHAAIRKEPWGGWRTLAAAAVLLAVFAGGMLAGRFVPGFAPQAVPLSAQQGWREAVANYQRLFVKDTLVRSEDTWTDRQEYLRAALGHIGIDLTVAKVTVAPLDLKYANVLSFNGKPLVQMAYLFGGETPVSFCIIKSPKPPHGIMAERRLGLNIAHWQSGEYGFMVIGDVPEGALNEIAKKLQAQMS